MNKVILTKEMILGQDDLVKEWVDVPEWNGGVYVRVMRASERDRYEGSLIQGSGKTAKVNIINARAKLVVLTVVDEEGNPLFDYNDYKELGKKSAKAVDTIFEAAQKINGLKKEDMDDMLGNLKEGQSGDSHSD